MLSEEVFEMPRGCTACNSESVDYINTALIDGQSYSTIAARSGVSIGSLRRHFDHHVNLDAETARSAGLDPVSWALRLHDIAETARIVRQTALDNGHPSVVLKAGDAEGRALAALAGFGVKHGDLIDKMQTLDAMSRASWRVAASHPEVAELIATELEMADHLAMANDVRQSLISETNRKELA